MEAQSEAQLVSLHAQAAQTPAQPTPSTTNLACQPCGPRATAYRPVTHLKGTAAKCHDKQQASIAVAAPSDQLALGVACRFLPHNDTVLVLMTLCSGPARHLTSAKLVW